MPDNPYSSPRITDRHNSLSLIARLGGSNSLFLVVAFLSAWVVFYVAYFVNGFGYGYLNSDAGIGLLSPLLQESLIVASIVSVLAASALLLPTKLALRNYIILAAICALEFVLAYYFFAALFEI